MTMPYLYNGQEFVDLSADEFRRVNRAANNLGLMAFVTMIRERDEGKLISFHLKSKFDA
jgi:hypothetical protein